MRLQPNLIERIHRSPTVVVHDRFDCLHGEERSVRPGTLSRQSSLRSEHWYWLTIISNASQHPRLTFRLLQNSLRKSIQRLLGQSTEIERWYRRSCLRTSTEIPLLQSFGSRQHRWTGFNCFVQTVRSVSYRDTEAAMFARTDENSCE